MRRPAATRPLREYLRDSRIDDQRYGFASDENKQSDEMRSSQGKIRVCIIRYRNAGGDRLRRGTTEQAQPAAVPSTYRSR
jgi:hypothetical protein